MTDLKSALRSLIHKARIVIQRVVLGVQAVTQQLMHWVWQLAKTILEFVAGKPEAMITKLKLALDQIDKLLAEELPVAAASEAQIRSFAQALGLDHTQELDTVRNDILCAVAIS